MPRKGEAMPEEERAKRRKDADAKRTEHVMLRLTLEEVAKLDKRRAASGRRRTEQAVHELFGRAEPVRADLTTEQREKLTEAVHEIAEALNTLRPRLERVGANVNQIAKRTNLAAKALDDDPRARSAGARDALARIAEHGPVVTGAVREVGAVHNLLASIDARVMGLLIEAGARLDGRVAERLKRGA